VALYTVLTCLREWFGAEIDEELLNRVEDMPEEQCEALCVHLAQNLGRIEIPELRPGETRPLIKAGDYFAPVRQQLLLADRALVYSPMSYARDSPSPYRLWWNLRSIVRTRRLIDSGCLIVLPKTFDEYELESAPSPFGLAAAYRAAGAPESLPPQQRQLQRERLERLREADRKGQLALEERGLLEQHEELSELGVALARRAEAAGAIAAAAENAREIVRAARGRSRRRSRPRSPGSHRGRHRLRGRLAGSHHRRLGAGAAARHGLPQAGHTPSACWGAGTGRAGTRGAEHSPAAAVGG
jgi:hypothetical protein